MTSVLSFLVLICVLVFVHEYGHFWAARRCGVKVLRFSIGFGKVLFRKTDEKGTEFVFSLIPLGGYVQIVDHYPNREGIPYEQTMGSKTVAQRAFIVAAGPMVNFLFAIVAYWAVFIAGVNTVKPVVGEVLPNSIAAQANLSSDFEFSKINGSAVYNWEDVLNSLVGAIGKKQVKIEGRQIGQQAEKELYLDLSNWQVDVESNLLTSLGIRPITARVEPTIRSVVSQSAAELAGIQVGDKIIAINGNAFDWGYLTQEVRQGKTIVLQIERENANFEASLTPKKSENGNRYIIGIQPNYQPLGEQYVGDIKYDILTAFTKSLEKVWTLIKTIIQFIGNLLTGNLGLDTVGGPVTMAKGAAVTASYGLIPFLSFMALISVNLGVMNLFPLLPLDGGRLVCLAYEGVFRRPLPRKLEAGFQSLGLALVLTLMGFALFNDVIRF